MNGNKIIVLGCCGSGKSTLTRELQQKLKIPIIHLDKLFWKPNWINCSNEEFDILLKEEMKKECWIMDGNYLRTIPIREKACDVIIYLDFPRWRCMLRVIKRVIKSYGKVREDMGEGCPERLDFEFLKYVWNFHEKNCDKIDEILSASKKQIYILKTPKQVKKFLKGL